MNTTITPPKKKRNKGQQPADDNHHQTKILGFRIGEGSHGCSAGPGFAAAGGGDAAARL